MPDRMTPERLAGLDRCGGLTCEEEAELRAEVRAAWADCFALNAKIAAVEVALERKNDEREKLQAFKTWCHSYLDAHGVPHHPPGTHGAEGCRIGDRLDWLLSRVGELEAALENLLTKLQEDGHDDEWGNTVVMDDDDLRAIMARGHTALTAARRALGPVP